MMSRYLESPMLNKKKWSVLCCVIDLKVSVDSLLQIAQHAVDNNKVFALNLSAPFLIQFFQVCYYMYL